MLKNIVVVCDFGFVEGGATRIAFDTAKGLKSKGYNVTYFCAVGPVDKELQDSGVEVICLNQADILHEKNRLKAVMRGIWNKTAGVRFAELLKKMNREETAIHVHTWTKGLSSIVFQVAEKQGFKTYITVHDYFLVCPNGGLFDYKTKQICEHRPMSLKCMCCNCDSRSYFQKVFRLIRQTVQNHVVFGCANLSFIFISQFSKRAFFNRIGESKIPENRRFFLSNMISVNPSRQRVVCENNDTYFYVGGLQEGKGVRIFCEAVTKAGVNASIIGQGPLYDELKAAYPDIQFWGWKSKEEMETILHNARCMVFSAIWYEVSPLTPLEMMGYGIPVLCSDKNAAGDYILEGRNGLMYVGTSSDDLKRVILLTQDNDMIAKMSHYAFDGFDEETLSVRTYIDNLLTIFEA